MRTLKANGDTIRITNRDAQLQIPRLYVLNQIAKKFLLKENLYPNALIIVIIEY